MDEIATDPKLNSEEKLRALQTLLGENGLPEYLLKYVFRVCPDGAASIAVHKSQLINEGYSGADVDKIERRKGFLGNTQLAGRSFEKAIHHFRIIRNTKEKARLFYRFQGSIQFIKNLRQ
jgi:hypothetical protein